MIFEVNPVLVRVFEPVDNAGCDDGILNSLVCFLLEILGEKDIGLDGRGDIQQFLASKRIRTCPRKVATKT